MAQEERDTERTAVKTYIPAYQRDEWERHAEQLDMSRSEFVRTMVQVGRRSLDGGGVPPAGGAEESDTAETSHATDGPVSGHDLDDHVVETLAGGETLSWDELLAELTDNVEERLEDSLERLQRENVVQYAGRYGGYTLIEGDGD